MSDDARRPTPAEVSEAFRADRAASSSGLDFATVPGTAPVLGMLRTEMQRRLREEHPDSEVARALRAVLDGSAEPRSLLEMPAFAPPSALRDPAVTESVRAAMRGGERDDAS